MTDIDDQVALKLAAGRATAGRRMPYMSTALYAIQTVECNDIKTAAVDKAWRMYWNRDFIAGLSAEEVATVWLHEVGHLLRDHNRRAATSMVPDIHRRDWNRAADAPINADLREAGILVFNWMVFPESIDPDATYADTTEYLYQKITGGASADAEEPPEEDEKHDEGAQSPESDSPGSDEDDVDEGSLPGDSEGENDDGDESTEPADDGQPADGPDASDDQDDGDGDGDGEGEGEGEGEAEGDQPGDGDGESDQPGDGHTDCGSGSGGKPREWEKPSASDDGSVDEGRAQNIRQQVAQETMEYEASGRGSVPAGMSRWAQNYLQPQVDWKRELRAAVRRMAANVMGRSDYTYQRPRRNAAVPGAIFPGMVDRPPPVTRVIVDTSGSMVGEQLEQCVAEIGEIIKRLSRGGGTVDVISCDAAVAMMETIRKPTNIELKGGGGTDMRVGIRVAAETKPRADLIITLTDGGTPWPEAAPEENPGAHYIVVIIPPKRQFRGKGPKTPPTWMHTIVMEAA